MLQSLQSLGVKDKGYFLGGMRTQAKLLVAVVSHLPRAARVEKCSEERDIRREEATSHGAEENREDSPLPSR